MLLAAKAVLRTFCSGLRKASPVKERRGERTVRKPEWPTWNSCRRQSMEVCECARTWIPRYCSYQALDLGLMSDIPTASTDTLGMVPLLC